MFGECSASPCLLHHSLSAVRLKSPGSAWPTPIAVVQRGDRALPVAMRLDAASGRWTPWPATSLGDAIYPQPGLRDTSPKVRPGLRERLILAIRGFVEVARMECRSVQGRRFGDAVCERATIQP
jgi:hypothetical protein